MTMDQLKRKLSFRKKKDKVPECSKPHQWQEDEKKVRDGSCSFQVRYMGCVEVYESRGMQVCEDAVKALRSQSKGKYQRAILYVSGDALRVVDEISKSMVVDQTIEKVSFCAPDRNHEKGFAYICRDGTTRRWMCHSFLAVKESGERLSHAVGCAFAICLEKKQRREKDSVNNVQVTYNPNQTSFTRTGSFRQASLTERISDPQTALVAEPIPEAKIENPYAVQRPHATSSMLERQGSFRGFNKLHESSSPFKRTLSLRLSELPSTLQRQNAIMESPAERVTDHPIQEASPSQEQSPDTISDMCQQVSRGLGVLSNDDPFSNAPATRRHASHLSRSASASGHHPGDLNRRHVSKNSATAAPFGREVPLQPQPAVQPIKQSNPWVVDQSSPKSPTAEDWLSNVATPQSPGNPFSPQLPMSNSSAFNDSSKSDFFGPMSQTTHVIQRPSLPQFSQFRSNSFDTQNLPVSQKRPTLSEIASQQRSFTHNGNVGAQWPPQHATSPVRSSNSQKSMPDPFDVEWASKATSANNPFRNKNTKTEFQVQI